MLGHCSHDYRYSEEGYVCCKKCGHTLLRTGESYKFKSEKDIVYGKESKIKGIVIVVALILIVGYWLASDENVWKPTHVMPSLDDIDIIHAEIKPVNTPVVEYTELMSGSYNKVYKYAIRGGFVEYRHIVDIGLNEWADLNPGMKFQEVTDYSDYDVIFTFKELGSVDYAGLYCSDGCDKHMINGEINTNSYTDSDFWDVGEILVDTGDYDCNGNRYEYNPESMIDIVKHEFGHHLGIEHNRNQNHLMYGDDYEFPFDNLGYDIPSSDVEYYESVSMNTLDEKISKMSRELYRLDRELARYPSTMHDTVQYSEYLILYDKYEKMTDTHNESVEQYNCMIGYG